MRTAQSNNTTTVKVYFSEIAKIMSVVRNGDTERELSSLYRRDGIYYATTRSSYNSLRPHAI